MITDNAPCYASPWFTRSLNHTHHQRIRTLLDHTLTSPRVTNVMKQQLVGNEHGITKIARCVDYTSTSHFINENRNRFRTTHRTYCDLQSLSHELGLAQV